MRDVPDIVKILRAEEKSGLLKNNIKKDIYDKNQNDELLDSLWFNQWRFL